MLILFLAKNHLGKTHITSTCTSVLIFLDISRKNRRVANNSAETRLSILKPQHELLSIMCNGPCGHPHYLVDPENIGQGH